MRSETWCSRVVRSARRNHSRLLNWCEHMGHNSAGSMPSTKALPNQSSLRLLRLHTRGHRSVSRGFTLKGKARERSRCVTHSTASTSVDFHIHLKEGQQDFCLCDQSQFRSSCPACKAPRRLMLLQLPCGLCLIAYPGRYGGAPAVLQR